MKTILLRIKGNPVLFVIKDILSYFLGKDDSVHVTMKKGVWHSLYIDPTIPCGVKNRTNNEITICFFDIEEYETLNIPEEEQASKIIHNLNNQTNG